MFCRDTQQEEQVPWADILGKCSWAVGIYTYNQICIVYIVNLYSIKYVNMLTYITRYYVGIQICMSPTQIMLFCEAGLYKIIDRTQTLKQSVLESLQTFSKNWRFSRRTHGSDVGGNLCSDGFDGFFCDEKPVFLMVFIC